MGIIGNRPASVARSIEAELAARGFPGARVAVDHAWTAALTGSVTGEQAHAAALAMVRGRSEIKRVEDRLDVKVSPAELQQRIQRALAGVGLHFATSVGEDYRVTVEGVAESPSERERLAQVVRSQPNISGFSDRTKKSAAWRADDIRQALRQAGLASINVGVGGTGEIVLRGSVPASAERERAQQLAKSTDPDVVVANQIDIVTPPVAAPRQAASQTAPPPSAIAPPTPAPAISASPTTPPPPAVAGVATTDAVEGVWVGRLRGGPLGQTVVLRITRAAVGQSAGITLYGTGRTPACGGRLVLQSAAGGIYVFHETITRPGVPCPGGGTIRLTAPNVATGDAAWSLDSNPGTIVARAEIRRRSTE
jgi:osmotically-inducible protein OsmY